MSTGNAFKIRCRVKKSKVQNDSYKVSSGRKEKKQHVTGMYVTPWCKKVQEDIIN